MSTTHILIVEDERIIARGIEKQLQRLGYAVAGSVSTGEEAVQTAADLQPDLILMDISLGRGIDGVEAAGLIRRQLDVPVVYLTANSDDATLQRAKGTDPFGYILKPYEDKDLQTAIEMGLYRHQMEGRLRENEQWLAATLGSIGDGVIATDANGLVRFINLPAEQLTGWKLADAVGRDVREIFQIVEEKTRQPVKNPALDALEKCEPSCLAPNTILIDKNEVERPIEDSAAPIRAVNGTVSGAVLVFRDITERRRLEQQLEDQHRHLEAANRCLEVLAATDGLTHLKNRRAFEERLAEEITRASRYSTSLSLLLLDVDHFKQFNDGFGHPAGDGVLQDMACLLEQQTRSTDSVARYGGEEFAILLPNTDQMAAVTMGERIRRAVAEGEWQGGTITVSIGASTLNSAGGNDAALVQEADTALYRSKQSGRNCVHHANGMEPAVKQLGQPASVKSPSRSDLV